jgi:hypothetical protein
VENSYPFRKEYLLASLHANEVWLESPLSNSLVK